MPESVLPPVKKAAQPISVVASSEVSGPSEPTVEPEPMSLPEQFRRHYSISEDHHAALRAALPEEAIERTSGIKTGKGYDTTGYGYQWIADRFDEVFGPEHWRETRTIISAEPGEKFGIETVFESTIQVGFWVNVDGRVSQFCIVASHSHYGGHIAKMVSDAYKGGATNAFKKCAAFGYGVGSDAWRNAIDEDNQDSASGEQGRPVSTSSTAPPLDEWDGSMLVWFGQDPPKGNKGRMFKDVKDEDLVFWYEKLDSKKIKQCAQAELARRQFSQDHDDDLPI